MHLMRDFWAIYIPLLDMSDEINMYDARNITRINLLEFNYPQIENVIQLFEAWFERARDGGNQNNIIWEKMYAKVKVI